MPVEMTPMVSVRTFLNKDVQEQLGLKEFGDFWKALTPAEKDEYAKSAAQQLGVTLVAPKAQ